MRRVSDDIWQLAERQARRSDNKAYRTGCVLIDPRTRAVITRGCAHHGDLGGRRRLRAVHAEQHALTLAGPRAQGAWAVIVTIRPSGRHAVCSRPCAMCARHLHAAGVPVVVFYELDERGVWHERREHTDTLVELAESLPDATYARSMRIIA